MRHLQRLSARPRALVGCALLTAVSLGACSSGADLTTPIPSAALSPATSTAAAPTGPGTTGQGTTGPSAASCTDATTSYTPTSGAPDPAIASATLAAIKQRGVVKVGVSADSYRLASRNPLTGQLEGFDIDIARRLAQGLLGDPTKVQLVVIATADRLTALTSGKVDMVVRAFSMTCDRWQTIDFSAEYYQAGQKILVHKGSPATSFADLAGKKVCAPSGTSSLSTLQRYPDITAVTSDTHTGCLVLFQQGDVDAITGDDTVLAGLAAQDPYAVVPKMAAVTSEPYGIGVKKGDPAFVRLLNQILVQMDHDGSWQRSYDTWFSGTLGPATPPAPVFGRAG